MPGLGTAWVGVEPDAAGFGPAVKAQLTAALANVRPQIAVTVDQGKLGASVAASKAQLGTIASSVSALQARLGSMRAAVDTVAAESKIAALQVRANSLARTLSSAGPGTDALKLESQLLNLQAAAEKAATAADTTSAAVSKVNIVSGNWFRTLMNIGGTGVPLFAGALGQLVPALEAADSGVVKLANHLLSTTSAWHVGLEAVVEFVAIWGPAALAVTAFGLAAAPTVMAVGKQLNNMNTAAQATGRSFQSLATSGDSVTAAVKPTVLEAFGIALNTMKSSSGTLAPILATLGQGFDQLVAKASVALGGGSGGGLFKQGSADALALANSFTSLGSIIGTALKAVPGYAEVLLGFGNDALGAAAGIAKLVEPVLAFGLAAHGAVLYGGLFGTAAAKLFGGLVSGATSAGEALAGISVKFLGDQSKVTEGLGKMLLGLDGLSAGPVIAGIALVTGAIAAVVLYLKASKDAADSFNGSIQATVKNASALTLQSALTAGITATTTQYVAAQKQLVTVTKASTDAMNAGLQTGRGGEAQLLSNTGAVAQATATTAQYQRGIQSLTGEQTNMNANLSELAKTFGTSLPGAVQLANGAQVTSNQLTAKGAENTATLNAQVAGYVTMLGVVTPGTGRLNEALNAINVTSSAQVGDIQKVMQAYTSWIGIVTGGDSAFASFEEGQGTLNDELEKGSAAGVKLTTSSGKLTEQQKLLGTALIGTSTSALAARQAFDAQVTSATSLYGNLSQLATVSGNTASAQQALNAAGKDLVAQLLPMAKGSAEATAEVSALAQMVGGPATDSYQVLSKWVGNTKGAEGDLDTQQTILTISSANLTTAAKNLNTALNTMVTSGEAAAIAKGLNLTQIQDTLAASVENSNGKVTTATTNLAGQYYEALIHAGDGANTAKGDVDTFLAKLGATPAMVAVVNAALAKLPKTVSVGVSTTVTATGEIKALMSDGLTGQQATKAVEADLLFSAAGGVVPGGTHGRDSVPAMLAPGELVIPSTHAAAFGDQARRAGIPGFSAGGVAAEIGQIAPVTTAAAGNFAASVSAQFVKLAQQSATAAVTAALAAGVTGNTAAYESDVLSVMKMLNIPLGDLGAIMKQMQTESGGNPLAVNNTDINAQNGTPSTGLMQVIAGTFDAYAGPYRNTGPFLNGVSVNPDANIYAGLNYAIHRYGMANLTSVLGQGHGYSAGGMIPEPVVGWGASGRRYSFAEHGPEQVIPGGQAAAGGSGLPPMTAHQANTMIGLLQTIARTGQQAPYAQAEALRQSAAAGVRRGYWNNQ